MLRELERSPRGSRRLAVWLAISVGCSVLVSSCRTTDVGFDYERAIARFVFESDQNGSVVTLPVSGVRIQVDAKAVITEFDILNVSVAEAELGACLQFTLTHQASRILYQESASNQGRRMVMVINGAPIGVRRIDRPIADGVFNMFVEIPDEGLPALAQNLRGTSIEIQKKIHG